MTARISTKLRVMLDATSPAGMLAADMLAAAAGITVAEAMARLADAPCELCPAADPDTARWLVQGLTLFGLRVRTERADTPPCLAAPRFDMALLLARPDENAVGLVAARLGRTTESVRAALSGPTGLILTGLEWTAVAAWRKALRAAPGLRHIVSDPQVALYDLLPSGAASDRSQAVALLVHLRRLGIPDCPLTGAVGAGLDLAMRNHLLRRFPKAGFVAVNRDFQRFDLVLMGVNGLDAAELGGFLRTRGSVQAARDAAADPLRIECALGRADALAFQSDYAAIGLDTRLRLVWPHAARMS